MKKRTIIGLAVIAAAVATMFAAPSVASATGKPSYILAVWKNPAGSPKFPQNLVTSYETNNVNVNVLKDYATECGTFYQSDLYANDEATAKLIAGKVLRGGDESWPLDNKGNQIQRYSTLTTDPCPVVVTPPPVVTPDPTPPAVTPTPVPPVTIPEVPSSPATPTPTPSPTSPTPSQPVKPIPTPETNVAPVTPSTVPNVAPPQRTAQTCQQAGVNVKTTDRNLDADGDGIGCETRGVAPVPTPIRTEAKFTG